MTVPVIQQSQHYMLPRPLTWVSETIRADTMGASISKHSDGLLSATCFDLILKRQYSTCEFFRSLAILGIHRHGQERMSHRFCRENISGKMPSGTLRSSPEHHETLAEELFFPLGARQSTDSAPTLLRRNCDSMISRVHLRLWNYASKQARPGSIRCQLARRY